MPNWCENHVRITGNKDTIQKLIDAKLSLEQLLPIPKELQYPENYLTDENVRVEFEKQKKVNLEKHGSEYWYDWCLENWGTKWDIDLHTIETMDDEIYAVFSTAWSPPIEAMKALVKQNKDLEIDMKYIETGMGFVGRLYITDKTTDDQCLNYSTANQLKNVIGELGTHEFEKELEYLE